jgi:hypothetical protein
MVKMSRNGGGAFGDKNTKIPFVPIIQVVVLAVTGFYAFFLLRGPASLTEAAAASIVDDNKEGPATIAYAVSVTGCGSDPITEGAAVLKHSIHLSSMHGDRGGRYGYKMYAIYHPDATECAAPLADLGYEMLERNTPIAVKDIEGEFLRSKIESNGCCGEKELIKLEAYTLTDHPVVVHLDLDVLVLRPLDDLFDAMIIGKSGNYDPRGKIKVQWPNKPFPEKVNAFITRDCKLEWLGS